MSSSHDREKRERCEAINFVDKHRSELIQKVGMVMPVVEELVSHGSLDEETHLQIRRADTDEEKMIELYKALDAGGDRVKSDFYSILREYEPHLFNSLESKEYDPNPSSSWTVSGLNPNKVEGESRKHKPSYPEYPGRVKRKKSKEYDPNPSSSWKVSGLNPKAVKGESRKHKLPDPEYPGIVKRKMVDFVNNHRSELIQKVGMVMPVVEELVSHGSLDEETHLQIKKQNTDEEKMIELYKALDAGGDRVKSDFYSILREYEPHLFNSLDRRTVILHYKTKVADKYKFVTEYILPSDEHMELAARYTEPVIIQRSKERTEKYYRQHVRSACASSQLLANDKNQSIRIDQLFSPDSDGNTPKTVILLGDSGRGKSFMLQKIMLDWACGELYSENFVVFLLKFDELKSISEEMSLIELLRCSCSLTLFQISQILQVTPEKVLFLIDGIDEYIAHQLINFTLVHSNPSKKNSLMVILGNLLRGILLPESNLLVTTQYIAADVVMNHLKGPQRFTETEGFSERGVQEYFQKFFQDEQLFRKTYERVKTNQSLMTSCSVPLLCWMVCFCLKKHYTDVDHVMRELKTTTSIYVHFVSTILEHHDHSQSVLGSLCRLAEKGVKMQEGFFDENSVTATGLDPATSIFLNKDTEYKIRNRLKPWFKFMHLSFQEFFTALYYVSFHESSWIDIPSVTMFLCGLFNEKVSSRLLKNIKWTVPQTITLKKNLQENILTMKTQPQCKLFFLHCLYELHDEAFVRRSLGGSMDLSNVSLRNRDCWVLLYCFQCCPQIRDLNLMYCDLTAEKLKILQPALCMCETLRFSVEHLSEVGDLIQILGESKILRELKIQEDENSAESPRWSLGLSVTRGDFMLSLSSSENKMSFPAGLKTLDLKVVTLDESWASVIISLVQTCTSLQQLSVSVTGLLLNEGLEFLHKSLTGPHRAVSIEGRQCSKPTDQCREHDRSHSCNEKVKIHFKPKELEELNNSGLNRHCQSCVDVSDSNWWVQVEPSVCRDEKGSKFRISTQAGRFECSRTRMRWVCAGDVTLQYCAVDGRFLSAELERLQCERIGPVIDVTVISGKLEEAHLPHYACLAESDPSLKDAVKLLSKRDEGISLQSVELTRYHAKILQPSFSLTTLIINWFMKWEQHCDLLLYMHSKDPLFLHIYFFPVNDTCSKEKVEQSEKSSRMISHPRPNKPFRMKTPHLLEVPGASVHPVEGISFRTDVDPNFFKVRQRQDGDVELSLIREEDKMSVWTATIWREEFAQLNQRQVQDEQQLNCEMGKVQFFDKHRLALIQRVNNFKSIADKLREQRIIHEELYSEITHTNLTSQDIMRKICYSVHSSGTTAKVKFIVILQEEEPYLFEELMLSDF